VQLLANDPVPAQTESFGGRFVSLAQLLEESDVLTLHLSPENLESALLGGDELELMKSTALLVNTSRGRLVDEEALLQALRQGRLAGAFLDVFQQEPYQGPLTELDNVLLTPHIGSYAAEARERMELESVDNLIEFLAEKEERS
jgi:D-3-phosphoglycerate dehydrogenase